MAEWQLKLLLYAQLALLFLICHMSSVSIDSTPYAVMVLHAVKYPFKGIHGLLFGTKNENDYTVKYVVPLSHETALLAPCMELGLLMTTNNAVNVDSESKLIGAYFSNASYKDKGLNPYTTRIVDKISHKYGSPGILIQICNASITPDHTNICTVAYTHDNNSWKAINVNVSPCALTLTSEAISQQLYRKLVDVDSHLDDPSLDFYNSRLRTQLAELLVE